MNGLLFIDDEEGIRRSVSRALKKSAYEVFLAENGEEGVRWLADHPEKVSTVVSDFKMPGLSGMETLNRVGRINPEITRILLTGYATMEAAIQATNEGIDGFLTKPFDNADLREKIMDISLRKRLRQFVPEEVFRKFQSQPGALAPTYHEVSVLFCDIRNFTRMSDGAKPEEIAQFLNHHFFSPIGEIAYGHGGIVDKHMGDSLMVVFGALSPHPRDTGNAVRAALAMQAKAACIDRALPGQGPFRLSIGIGISTGRVYSGVLGSLRKKEFTSIGMPVNIASRLQQLAGPGEVLASRSTVDALSAYDNGGEQTFSGVNIVPLPQTRIKGLQEPVPVFKISKNNLPKGNTFNNN
jgi:class 3 adenylate cyclase